MRKFAFRLQRALRFALLRENQKKTQVASSLQRIRFLEKYLSRLAGEVRTAVEQSHRDIHSLSAEAHRRAIVPKMDEEKRIENLLQEEKQALQERQGELVRLSQRRRSLESLREKRKQEFRLERSRYEQKTIDEMAGSRRSRDTESG